jgi:hypothetical protein
VLGAAPLLAIVASLNSAFYGSPLRSGYGNASDLFSLAHMSTNVAQYGRALVETQTPFIFLGVLTPFLSSGARRSRCWLAIGVMCVITAVYLLYKPYPEWWYLRFLLAVVVIGLALASAALETLVGRISGVRLSRITVFAIALGLGVFYLRTAIDRQAFALQALEGRFRQAAEVVRDRLPPNTVAITIWDSGSIRYHADRPVVLWDAIDASWLDQSLQWLREQGHSPVVVVERWEEPLFRDRFAGRSVIGGLDWPPRFDIDHQLRIFDPADRSRYFAGELILTEIVR